MVWSSSCQSRYAVRWRRRGKPGSTQCPDCEKRRRGGTRSGSDRRDRAGEPIDRSLAQAADALTTPVNPIEARRNSDKDNVAKGCDRSVRAAGVSCRPRAAGAGPDCQPEPALAVERPRRQPLAGLPATGPIPVPPETPAADSAPATGGRKSRQTPLPPGPSSPLGDARAHRSAQPPKQTADPLLGPNPGLMPQIPDLSELESARPVASRIGSSRPRASGAAPNQGLPRSRPGRAPGNLHRRPIRKAGREAAAGPDAGPRETRHAKPTALPELPDLPDPVAPRPPDRNHPQAQQQPRPR